MLTFVLTFVGAPIAADPGSPCFSSGSLLHSDPLLGASPMGRPHGCAPCSRPGGPATVRPAGGGSRSPFSSLSPALPRACRGSLRNGRPCGCSHWVWPAVPCLSAPSVATPAPAAATLGNFRQCSPFAAPPEPGRSPRIFARLVATVRPPNFSRVRRSRSLSSSGLCCPPRLLLGSASAQLGYRNAPSFCSRHCPLQLLQVGPVLRCPSRSMPKRPVEQAAEPGAAVFNAAMLARSLSFSVVCRSLCRSGRGVEVRG